VLNEENKPIVFELDDSSQDVELKEIQSSGISRLLIPYKRNLPYENVRDDKWEQSYWILSSQNNSYILFRVWLFCDNF